LIIGVYHSQGNIAFCAEEMPAVVGPLVEEVIVDPNVSTNMANVLRPNFFYAIFEGSLIGE